MGRLKNHIAYLAGPMEAAPDMGVNWRNWITPHLKSMGIGVFNPCDKPCNYGLEDENTKNTLIEAKSIGDWTTVHKICKEFVGIDARMVNLSSIYIGHIDKNIHMCGTYVEFAWAVQQKKPTLIHCEQGKANAPGFIHGMIPSELIFSYWDDLVDYLKWIDNPANEVKDLKRWSFFDFNKVF